MGVPRLEMGDVCCRGCETGSIIFVDFTAGPSTGGLGADFVAADFSLTTGIEGKWLAVSLSGKWSIDGAACLTGAKRL